MITVIVGTGDEARKFYIHKDIACEASPFFRGCLNTEYFPEGRTSTISLPEDDPEAFKVVLAFMYNVGDSLHDKDWITTETWFLAYVLADKLWMEEAGASTLCDFMGMVSSCSYNLFCTTLPQTAFKSPNSAATKFLIAQVAWDFAENGYHWFCNCDMHEVGTLCGWCQFFTDGGPSVVSVMKLVKGDQGEGVSPSDRGTKYWINQAKASMQAE